ncbi:hypothetical protein [Segetibacter sp.]|uniref:hypothetical protein n=1 Tax=Segetibacter sp. TaxID=2231182 RepID=UPI00262D1B77|nr:hypothetical protein [Segetibacter sp.]
MMSGHIRELKFFLVRYHLKLHVLNAPGVISIWWQIYASVVDKLRDALRSHTNTKWSTARSIFIYNHF